MQTKAIFALLLLGAFAAGAKQNKQRHNSGNEEKANTTSSSGNKNDAAPRTGSSTVNYHIVGAPLPPVRFVDSAGREYNNASLKNDANLFVMMFNPTCEHCESMTVEMGQHINLFKKSNIVLVATATMKPYFGYFYNNTKCGAHPQIKVVLDSCEFINRCFNYGNLPQINVYDADRNLIKIFSGIETIDSLKPYIQ